MARKIEVCDSCGKVIGLGDEYYVIPNKERQFCSPQCMKEWIIDNMVDEAVDDWVEDHAECYEMCDADPYARFGVSESDFH